MARVGVRLVSVGSDRSLTSTIEIDIFLNGKIATVTQMSWQVANVTKSLNVTTSVNWFTCKQRENNFCRLALYC